MLLACFSRPARLRANLGSLVLSSLCLLPLSAACAAEPEGIDFDRQIRPLLSDNCFSCHGPDAAERQADLRLDMREEAVEQGAIDEANLTESTLLTRVTSTDPEMMMPPPKSNKRLTDAQKKLIADWVRQGAKYTQHWSFAPPRRPEVPAGAHAVDYLIEQVLKREGLTFSPPADPATLARRLSLDLIGLPPSEAQIAALVSDHSPAGINRLVEELLASPHYGERMAISWLDVVRFADTIGYHSDTPRNVYPYRDYVIASFNNNKRFDQFTIEQVAGDLLPDATQEQKVASCFNRLLLTTEEGGAQSKDYEARYLEDRVRAIGTAWLGLTIGCSQCHDHKFDPITARDFYSMGAFFADIEEAIIGAREPGMPVPSPEQSEKMQLLKVTIGQLQAELSAEHSLLAEERAAWEQRQLALLSATQAWTTLAPRELSASAGSTLKAADDHSVLASGERPDKEIYQLTLPVAQEVKEVRALRLEALPDESLPGKGSGRAGNGNFVLTEVIAQLQRAGGKLEPVKFAAARASLEQAAAAEKHPHKKWSAASVIDNDASGAEWGWAILPDVTKPQQLQISLAEPLTLKAGDAFRIEMRNNHGDGSHSIGHFRWSISSDPLAYEAPLGEGPAAELAAIVKIPSGDRKPEQAAKLLAAFNAETPALADVRAKLSQTQKELADLEAALPRCLVSKSLAAPRTVRILPRGNWQDESGPIVTPALPKFFAGQAPTDRRLNRLDLARWLVSPDNPLTARVFVNRLWKQFFGVGLSKNLDDLGAQGEAPSNGPLLDFLAVEFVESGWDVKHLVRLLVSSRAYQQTSDASPELLERDPENRLVARQSRYRLPAELVRDNALAISGLLVKTIGGPSVKPYQPDGYWENLNFPPRNYVADPAPAEYRRGLYVWWQRSFVHPSMLAFDAPTREECAADRAQSNIPQQALVLLNDPTYLEAARALADNLLVQGEGDQATRIKQAFRTATAREPSASELELLLKLHAESLKSYAADSAAAEALLKGIPGAKPDEPVAGKAASAAERAACVQVGRAILNLHEVITRS